MSLLSFSVPRVNYDAIEEEVAKMPQNEQDLARRELFGEEPPIPETQEMINSALDELDIELFKIPEKDAYDTAQVICPGYVNSEGFRLLFLRADRFDAKLAAKRIVNYWDKKLEIFGPDNAFRRITLNDFDEEDQVALARGGFRVLPNKDSSSRAIVVSNRADWDLRRSHRNSMLRLLWYILHAAVEDVEVQRRGLVVFCVNNLPSSQHTSHDVKLDRKISKLLKEVLPIRLVALHTVVASKVLKLALEAVLFALGSSLRARYKQYSGTPAQNLDTFASFGVNEDVLPPSVGGSLDFDYEQWLATRRSQGN